MSWGRASAGAICNIALPARASFEAYKSPSADTEGADETDGEAEAVMAGETPGRPPDPAPVPVPASTDHTKITNPQRIATASTSSPARTTQPLALADRISMLAMAHTAPKPDRNAYRPT